MTRLENGEIQRCAMEPGSRTGALTLMHYYYFFCYSFFSFLLTIQHAHQNVKLKNSFSLIFVL